MTDPTALELAKICVDLDNIPFDELTQENIDQHNATWAQGVQACGGSPVAFYELCYGQKETA